MWAQLITMRIKDGKDGLVPTLLEQLRASEQPGSGLIRSTTMRDQKDPSRLYTLVVFESEAHARARENDPNRAAALQEARATMAELMDGPPEFVDLTVEAETIP